MSKAKNSGSKTMTATGGGDHETVIDRSGGDPVTGGLHGDDNGAAALDALISAGAPVTELPDYGSASTDTVPGGTGHAETENPADAQFAAYTPTLRVQRLDPAAQLPQYHSAGAACFDLRSLEPGHVAAGGARTFGTGLAFEVPDGFVMLILSRSGHGFKHDVRLANCVGVIDSDFRGEIRVALTNDHRSASFEVAVGDRIAQALLLPVIQWRLEEAQELSATARGTNGYGSTGK